MREIDFVARYGGKEFAIILPGTNLNDASIVAMRACEEIEKRTFHCDEKELRLTVSCGVAELLDHEDGNMLMARTDKALYAAKEGGRNCITGTTGKPFFGLSVIMNRPFQSLKSNHTAEPRRANPKKTRQPHQRLMPVRRNQALISQEPRNSMIFPVCVVVRPSANKSEIGRLSGNGAARRSRWL